MVRTPRLPPGPSLMKPGPDPPTTTPTLLGIATRAEGRDPSRHTPDLASVGLAEAGNGSK
ncbi:hypothetical protein GCM10010398_15130 [Streptomyces fimbriatus]